jgi:hypothetical protein
MGIDAVAYGDTVFNLLAPNVAMDVCNFADDHMTFVAAADPSSIT